MNRDVLVGIDLHKDRSSCFLLSEDDYVRFWGQLVSRPPFWIGNLVYGKRLLFVGYSIRDLHVRIPLIIASWLTRENYKKEGYHWAIMPEPDPIEQLLWRSRYVEVLDAKAEILLPEILRGSDGSQPAA